MSERDHQNPYGRGQQQGGQQRGNEGYDSPRQADQWQAEGSRQAGGDWQQDSGQRASDPYRFSGRSDPQSSAGYASRARSEAGWQSGDQRPTARNFGQGRESQQHFDRGSNSAQGEYRGGYPLSNFDASGGNDFGNFTSEDFGGRDFTNRGGGATGGARSSESYRPSYGPGSWGHKNSRSDHDDHDYSSWREFGESRGFLARASDEVASWFGDEDASRRRDQDRRENHSGRGPSGYTRSDERIREDANDHLTHDWGVDASHITVSVSNGEVTLDGTVDSRQAKRRAEDAVEHISGVKHVQNNLRVRDSRSSRGAGDQNSSSSASTHTNPASGTGTATSTAAGSTSGSSTTGLAGTTREGGKTT